MDINTYNTLTQRAETLVKACIPGFRKGIPDEPNYRHSFRVRDRLIQDYADDDFDGELFIAGLLHDVIEDGDVSADELLAMGFTTRIIELVRLCTHPMDVTDPVKRWMLMVAKLVEADNMFAWAIKLADLSDNLTQSKGLSPESRNFMVNVKAPLLIRLTEGNIYLRKYVQILRDEMERQRLDMLS
jgi:(p)ppGpp synthase/HD superfamily hydrolase